jgi:hypothetical protein
MSEMSGAILRLVGQFHLHRRPTLTQLKPVRPNMTLPTARNAWLAPIAPLPRPAAHEEVVLCPWI